MNKNTELTDGSQVTDEHRELKDNGQQKGYVVLTEAERAKGFVRPVREEYTHVGKKPKHQLRDLTLEEQERHKDFNYVKYEEYPESESPVVGTYWTQKQLSSGCDTDTTMGLAIAETYARDPKFYGATFCFHCKEHLPVDEFVWKDTEDLVGS